MQAHGCWVTSSSCLGSVSLRTGEQGQPNTRFHPHWRRVGSKQDCLSVPLAHLWHVSGLFSGAPCLKGSRE